MKVLILMGSDSDIKVMKAASEVLGEFGVAHRMTIASAHRTPERVSTLVKDAEKKGASAIICGAGMAAHLAGAVAAQTVLPVIGVPLDASPLEGWDALLSTVQMPPGIPVATVAVGKAGAKNAAHLALQIIARGDREMLKKLKAYRRKMARDVEKKAQKLDK
jgi:phosphoribosylamine--glycine ligase